MKNRSYVMVPRLHPLAAVLGCALFVALYAAVVRAVR